MFLELFEIIMFDLLLFFCIFNCLLLLFFVILSDICVCNRFQRLLFIIMKESWSLGKPQVVQRSVGGDCITTESL